MGSKTSKSVQHYTWNDVAKKQSKEGDVYHIVSESENLKLIHSLSNGSRYKELHQTVKNGLTHLGFRFSFTIDIFHVVTECHCAEDEHEHDSQETHIKDALDAQCDGCKDVTQVRVVAENIDDNKVTNGYCRYLNNEGKMESITQLYNPWWCKTGLIVSTSDEITKLYYSQGI